MSLRAPTAGVPATWIYIPGAPAGGVVKSAVTVTGVRGVYRLTPTAASTVELLVSSKMAPWSVGRFAAAFCGNISATRGAGVHAVPT